MKSFVFLPERTVGDATKKTPEPRVVFIKKSQLELGVHLCGGNLHGVFVAEVEDDSPAKGADGLVPGDLILEVSSELLSRSQAALCPRVGLPAVSGDMGGGGAQPLLASPLGVECSPDPLWVSVREAGISGILGPSLGTGIGGADAPRLAAVGPGL